MLSCIVYTYINEKKDILARANNFSETLKKSDWFYLYGFSPLWMRMCVFKLPMCVNVLWHMLHWYGLFWVCDRTCLAKSPAKMNDLSHWVHWNRHDSCGCGFSWLDSRRRPLPGPCAKIKHQIEQLDTLLVIFKDITLTQHHLTINRNLFSHWNIAAWQWL